MTTKLTRTFGPGSLGVFAAAGLALSGGAAYGQSSGGDQYSYMPSQLTLNGTIRDFKGKDQSGGHADFERTPTGGYAHYVGEAANELDSDGKPVFSSTGYKVSTEWTNAAGKNIINSKSYIASKEGDRAGAKAASPGGSTTTAAAFAQWFRDVSGVNMSQPLAITLDRQPGTNKYVFDDTIDSNFKTLGGFFPINGGLYGNYSSTGKNFHFTYEIETEFTYDKNKGHVFTFTGDDDVWVYIDGKLVIDIGGVHSKVSQTIDLDRLSWLENGKNYKLKFFFAERHTTQSNFRIETTLNLRMVQPPATSGLFD